MTFSRSATLFLLATLLAPVADADTNPTLNLVDDAYLLTIPEINHLGIGGYYQNAVLKHDAASDNWVLLRVKASKPVTPLGGLGGTQAIITTEHPIQVILKVWWTDSACADAGHVGLTYDEVEKRFDVRIYYTEAYAYPKEILLCGAQVIERQKFIPLPVYGLPAGTYHYNVGGEISGSFTLATDNVIE